jgi:hypothetical protein
MKYSKSTGCFYPEDIEYPTLPEDLIEVTAEEYESAMSRPANTVLDVQNGKLVLVTVELTSEQISVSVRANRNARLQELDALCTPLRWEGYSEAHREALRAYRTALLAVPQQADFPQNIDWPKLP